MRNYIQPGNALTLVAPYDRLSGDGMKVGSIFAVATTDALTGDLVEGTTMGVYELNKLAAQAWTVGAKIYWDDAAKECTTVSTANTLIGVATAAAANPSSTGRVRLNGSF